MNTIAEKRSKTERKNGRQFVPKNIRIIYRKGTIRELGETGNSHESRWEVSVRSKHMTHNNDPITYLGQSIPTWVLQTE